ncbi:MAG TPA: hypothetical protein VK196_12160 [Magnetospirillum sp.]|nr:hypothetical protein [Magnetospirillum sp.]
MTRFPPLTTMMMALAVAACSSEPRLASGPSLPPAPLPQWHVGDSVSWSNGQTETVVAVEGEVVRWRDQDGNTYAGYRNFVLPSLEWDYPETRATTTMDVAPTTLWPLRVGAEAHFKVAQRLTAKIHDSEVAYHDEWMCGVTGTERVRIRLGEFDTWQLRCQRYWRGSNMGEITWNYAPSLGQVVRRSWTGAEEPEELVAFGRGALAPTAGKVAAKVRQRGLESLPSGRKALGRTGTVEATIQPTATYRTASGDWCRDFLQTVGTATARATSAASACRDGDGKWQVVDRLKTKDD